jgi:N-formylglutamate amidohydrolase
MNNLYTIKQASGPLISLALHGGHFIDENLLRHIALSEHERFREEDPYSADIAKLPITQVVVHTSRFMIDLNRPKDKAIYKKKEEAWGLEVWKEQFPEELESTLMRYYNQFYEDVENLIKEKIKTYGYFLILDVHSYNHRRESPAKSSPASENPEINLGTFYNHPKWQPICKKFLGYLSACKIKDEFPDVRENIIFKGGGFTQWVSKNHGHKGCVISIEFKKTFMDEWTGKADIQHISHLNGALKGTIPLLTYELAEMHQMEKQK